MKKIFVTISILSTLLFACTEVEVENFSDEDIVDMVESDMASVDQSIAQTGAIAEEAESISLCSYGSDSTISFTSPNGDLTAEADWEWALVCTNQIPTGIELEYSLESDLAKAKITADNLLIGDFLLDNLLGQNNYTLNGDIASASSMTTTGRGGSKSFTTSTDYVVQNIEFDRSTYEIQGGSLKLTTKGNGQNGGSFNRTATLVFNGNQSGTLTLDNGNVYTINW